jgi:hypothetical protein
MRKRAAQNPNPDKRKLYGEDVGIELFQRIQMCLNRLRDFASKTRS